MSMGSCMKAFALCVFVFLTLAGLCVSERVDVKVKSVTSVAETDENFVCATMDYGPSSMCNYGQCPWPKVGILELVYITLFLVFDLLLPDSSDV